MTIIEKVEKMTNPSKDEGEWIAKTDIEEDGSSLKLVEHSEVGECNADCKTIAKAVEAVIGDSDTDIAEELWKVMPWEALLFQVSCRDTSASSCIKLHLDVFPLDDQFLLAWAASLVAPVLYDHQHLTSSA